MSILSTITRVFQNYGQDLTINSGGTNYTVRALLTLMDSGSLNNFFDGNESVALVKPALLLFVPGNDPNAGHLEASLFSSDIFGDGSTRPSQQGFVVRKIEKVRLGGVVVVYICACD